MKFAWFIAKRVTLEKANTTFTRQIVNIAVWGIALSVMVMLLATGFVKGFQDSIRDKVTGFGADVYISSHEINDSYESSPVSTNQEFYPGCEELPGISQIYATAYKPGILKTNDAIQGIVLKGYGRDYDTSFFQQYMQEGHFPDIHQQDKPLNEVVISKQLSKKMKLKVGDPVFLHFITSGKSGKGFNQRKRRWKVCGIYETGLGEDFDDKFLIVDLRHIQKLNYWDASTVGGFEIKLMKGQDAEKAAELIHDEYTFQLLPLMIETARERYVQLFDWLDFFDQHIDIILLIMILVSVINMSSTILILILDRTSMIGLFKAMGANNKTLQSVFLIQSGILIGRGILLGNALAILLSLAQNYLGIVRLPQEVYYIDVAKIHLTPGDFLIVDLLTMLCCLVCMILPSLVVMKISPVKAIRFN